MCECHCGDIMCVDACVMMVMIFERVCLCESVYLCVCLCVCLCVFVCVCQHANISFTFLLWDVKPDVLVLSQCTHSSGAHVSGELEVTETC